MLFSAWQAVTQAPHPVHLSRSTAIPHLCGIATVAEKLEDLLPSTLLLTSHFSLLTSNFSPRLSLVRMLAHLTGKHDQAAVGVAGARDLHTRRRPGERAGRGLGRRREDCHRIH